MQLFDIGFAIHIVKVLICTLPAVLGIIIIFSSKERKHEFRNKFCRQIFGISNAIPHSKFTRAMAVLGILMLLFSLVSTWFLLLRELF